MAGGQYNLRRWAQPATGNRQAQLFGFVRTQMTGVVTTARLSTGKEIPYPGGTLDTLLGGSPLPVNSELVAGLEAALPQPCRSVESSCQSA